MLNQNQFFQNVPTPGYGQAPGYGQEQSTTGRNPIYSSFTQPDMSTLTRTFTVGSVNVTLNLTANGGNTCEDKGLNASYVITRVNEFMDILQKDMKANIEESYAALLQKYPFQTMPDGSQTTPPSQNKVSEPD